MPRDVAEGTVSNDEVWPAVPSRSAEVVRMVADIRALLADPDARLSPTARHRWEGALTALEVVLGERPSLAREVADDL